VPKARHALAGERSWPLWPGPTRHVQSASFLSYLGEIHEQEIYLPETPANWNYGGSADCGETDVTIDIRNVAEGLFDKFSGKPLDLPFTYRVVQDVLHAVTVPRRNLLPPFAPPR
jgi:hypothetical protein